MTDVTVVIDAGSIGLAIARRVSAGQHVGQGDLRQKTAETEAKVPNGADLKVSTAVVHASSQDSVQTLVDGASAIFDVTGLSLPWVSPPPRHLQ